MSDQPAIGEEAASRDGDEMGIGRRLAELRQKRGMTMRELAGAASVSTSLVSQIESGKTNPTVARLQRLATALKVPVHYFLEPHDGDDAPDELRFPSPPAAGVPWLVHPAARAEFQPLANRATVALADGVLWERLTPHGRSGIEFLEVTYDVGTDSGPLTAHFGEEFVLLLSGELRMEFSSEAYTLHAGDSIVLDSSVPHRVVSTGDEPARAVWVNWSTGAVQQAAVASPPAYPNGAQRNS